MHRIPLTTPEPGHFEVGLVLHGDTNNTGEFIYTLFGTPNLHPFL